LSITSFIHELTWFDLPQVVQHQTLRLLLDIIGTGIAGRQTDLSRIIFKFVIAAFGGDGAQLWLDGRHVSPPGAALANGMTIDALDIHDGYNLTKGHIGAAVVPAIFATLNGDTISGGELLTRLAVGYEIAARAGIVLHETACDYHTSGAWNALGAAAVTARHLRLNREQTRHALGIAEYHGPRSQMMRCIEFPTMLKDGSGWGAMAGVSAAMMAAGGFSGAPAVTVEADEVQGHWLDLGAHWHILAQYFKPYAVCRWAQPAIAGALAIRRKHSFALQKVKAIRIHTFHEAVCLSKRRPQSTEEAQYSLPFSLASALVNDKLGPDQLDGRSLEDPLILYLADRVQLIEDEDFNAQFPAQRFSRTEIILADDTILQSGEHQPSWESSDPPTDEELHLKFHWLAGEMLKTDRVEELEGLIWDLAGSSTVTRLVRLMSDPPHNDLGEPQ
jgi:2-methylcitrate dehydratase PrpD